MIVVTFLLLRIVDTHSFFHFSNDDISTHCELCDIALLSKQLTPFIKNDFFGSEQRSITNYQIQFYTIFCYETHQYSVTLPKSVYNKPPPSVI
ncbi:hypothetical protein J8281_01570 [Aquimarina sp. U1-2]|uniref:hypothetical protein n=1 Tax=Aquimarina sp. U1-2 TaxID=2823141 RepID=UPI001AECC987|nr:hypothetical protein [Aquimarina sp. U1-2]MBP2830860.1 hypothetical protein [Aquimarina sp. U1-2]